MPITLKQVPAGKPGQLSYVNTKDYGFRLNVDHKVVNVDNRGTPTAVVKCEFDVRRMVDGKACGTSCPSRFPALIKFTISAPLETDISENVKIAAHMLNLYTRGGIPSPFIANDDEITVA